MAIFKGIRGNICLNGNQSTLLADGVLIRIQAVAADHADHGPRSHFHAVEGQRNGQTDEVHRVAIRIRSIKPVSARTIIVLSAEPEEAGAHVFVELTGKGDARAVSGTAAKDRAAGDETGQAEVLEPHTDHGVGLGDNPVNVAVTDLDHLAVGAEGSAVFGATPVLVADFEEHHALQGFGSDNVNLGTQTLPRAKGILSGVLFKTRGAQFPSKFPQALGLDVSSLRTGSGAKHKTSSEKQSHDALHVYSFLFRGAYPKKEGAKKLPPHQS